MGLDQNLVVELLRNQQEMLRQNQVLIRIGWNEKRELGRKKEPKSLLSKQKLLLGPPLIRLVEAAIRLEGSRSYLTGGNRAEKYLPSLPTIQHGEMGKGRMKEVGEWHRFLEVLVSWLALIDEAYVSEMRHCLKHPNVIEQAKLQSPVAARSAKLFYYLGQCLAKWERGLELLRSVSKRQGLSAAGYEVVRTLHQHYSIVSRMEAVYVRDECLKLHSRCGHLKKPMDVVRYLEDELSKLESKLINFPELKLSEADKVSLILQAISADARQYVVLHGHSNDWSSVSTTLKFYEEQLRMCELPGSSSSRALSEIICDHCGKKGHKKEKKGRMLKRVERPVLAEMVVKTMVKEKGKTTRASPKERARTKGKEKAKTRAKRRRKERVLDLQAVMEAAPPLLETRAELLQWP